MFQALSDGFGAYVHVPWCRARCPYCAFAITLDGPGAPFAAFVDGVLRERESWRGAFPGPARSVFLGGGTPSRLPAPELARLLAGLDRVPGAEVSAEANPEDATDAWLAGAAAAGVSRVSLGVQSFDPRIAGRLGRAHTSALARDAAHRVAAAGFASWSLDLIFAVPGQTLPDLDADLDALLATEPPHVALYGLTIEEGTPFERLVRRGTLRPVDDELWRASYDRVVERLAEAGLDRYEVSNFARAGHRSDHNLGYWTDRPYLGLGPSAHGYAPDGERWVNARELDTWLAGAPAARERPAPEQAAGDAVVAGIRSVVGLDRERLRARTGHDCDPGKLVALVHGGLITLSEARVSLTPAGFPLADAIASKLVDALAPLPRDKGGTEILRPRRS